MDRFDKQLIKKIEKKEREYNELYDLLNSVEIMTDNKLFQYYQKKIKKLKPLIDNFKFYKKLLSDYDTNVQLINMENDEIIIKNIIIENEALNSEIENRFLKLKQEFHSLKNSNHEKIIVEISYKSGNLTYINILFDIFKNYQEANNYELKIEKQSEKSIIFEISGDNVYNNLFFLSGNIKIVFEGKESIYYLVILKASSTSFDFNEEDVEIETLKSGGAGGQHINKTESAIRLTHIPTGISVICQDERSQLMNKKRALENLEFKLKQKFDKENENSIIIQRKNIKNALFSSTPALIINYDKNNIFCNKTQKYYKLKQVLDGNLQIIWSDVVIDGTKY